MKELNELNFPDDVRYVEDSVANVWTNLALGAMLAGDSGKVRQVLGNLVNNAVKFTPPGSNITLRLGRLEEALAAQEGFELGAVRSYFKANSKALAELESDGLLKPLPMDLRQRYRTQLLERQAETVFGHFMNQADKCKSDGRASMARSQVQQLVERLRALGISTERTQQLLAQGEEAYQYLLTGGLALSAEANKAEAG